MAVLSADLICLGATATDKFDAIRQAGELLVRGGRVRPEYVEDMVLREQSMSTSMNNGVAIPHGKDPDVPFVLRTGISVLQLAEGVPWDDDDRVSLVIGIAALAGEHNGVLMNLSDVVDDEAKLAELFATRDPQVILDCLNGAASPASPAPEAEAPAPAGSAARQVDLIVPNRSGLHARPAKVLVNLAKPFKSEIRIRYDGKQANAKSMVSVLKLGAGCGAAITLEVAGEDAELALPMLAAAILAGLGDVEQPGAAVPEADEPGAQVPVPEVAGIIRGIAAAPGIAIGPAFHFKAHELSLENLDAAPAGGPSLDAALAEAKRQLEALYQQMQGQKLAAEAAIFEAHIEILEDVEVLECVRELQAAGSTPARAWHTAVADQAAAIAALGDPLLSARADDLRDVGRRVLSLLLGGAEQSVAIPETPVVIVARELSPSDTASFDPERVLGFVIVEGGPTSHIAILARAMGLPAIVGAAPSVLAVAEGTRIVLNGNDGVLTVDPEPDVFERYALEQKLWLERRRRDQEQAVLPATTLDGQRVDVSANAGSPANAEAAVKLGADGIGLLRTEFLFLDRAVGPDEDEQYRVYRTIAETMGARPVIVRTLDIGGDKPVAYLPMKPEANPFLGERGIRLCLRQPDLFREQLRAILRAAPHGNLQIMFPMVSDLAELRQARAMVEEQRRRLDAPPVRIGIMVEVPSAALLADKFAPEVDFFSIGTNDLTQYTLAMDRGHAGLADRQDGLHPAVLRLIERTVSAAHQHGKRVDLCGELGSDAAAVPILVGLGVDELSVSVPAIPTVKAQVRTLTLACLQPLAQRALDCACAADVRELVRIFFASSERN